MKVVRWCNWRSAQFELAERNSEFFLVVSLLFSLLSLVDSLYFRCNALLQSFTMHYVMFFTLLFFSSPSRFILLWRGYSRERWDSDYWINNLSVAISQNKLIAKSVLKTERLSLTENEKNTFLRGNRTIIVAETWVYTHCEQKKSLKYIVVAREFSTVSAKI